MIEICAVFAPRLDHPKWRDDYYQLLAAQRASALRTGHFHTVVTDAELPAPLNSIKTELPTGLMAAMIVGVIKRLEQAVDDHICFVDVDCLIDLHLGPVFDLLGNMDLGLTYRANETAPINNGVMYVTKTGQERALGFFKKALEICGEQDYWGADQESISQAAAPVPQKDCNGNRMGAKVRFLSSKYFAAVPKVHLARHNSFVVHFKGETKDWMIDYAKAYHGWKD